ncbi:MAG: hypothetical protein MHM6MM_003170 [Cercozoa sp. M6MM]
MPLFVLSLLLLLLTAAQASTPVNNSLAILESRVLPPEYSLVGGYPYRVHVLFNMLQESGNAMDSYRVRVMFGTCEGSPRPPSVPVPLTTCDDFRKSSDSSDQFVLSFPSVGPSAPASVRVGFMFVLTYLPPATIGMRLTLMDPVSVSGPFSKPLPVAFQFNEMRMWHTQTPARTLDYFVTVNSRESIGKWDAIVVYYNGVTTSKERNDSTELTVSTTTPLSGDDLISIDISYRFFEGIEYVNGGYTSVKCHFDDITTIYVTLKPLEFSILPDAAGWAFHINEKFVPDPSFTKCDEIFSSLDSHALAATVDLRATDNVCSYGIKNESITWSHGTGEWTDVTGQGKLADTIIVAMPSLPDAYHLVHPAVKFGLGQSSPYFDRNVFDPAVSDRTALGHFSKAEYALYSNTDELRQGCVDEIVVRASDFAFTYGKPLEHVKLTVECFAIGDQSNTDRWTTWLQQGVSGPTLQRKLTALPADIAFDNGHCELSFSALNWIHSDWQKHESTAGNTARTVTTVLPVRPSDATTRLKVSAPSKHRRRDDLVLGATVVESACGEERVAPAEKYRITYELVSLRKVFEGAQVVVSQKYLPTREDSLVVRVEAQEVANSVVVVSDVVSIDVLLDPIIGAVARGVLRVLPNPNVELEVDYATYSFDPNGIYGQKDLSFAIESCRTGNNDDCAALLLSKVDTSRLSNTGILMVPSGTFAASSEYSLVVLVTVDGSTLPPAKVGLTIRVLNQADSDNSLSVSVHFRSARTPLLSQQDILRIEGEVQSEKDDAVIQYAWYEASGVLRQLSPQQLLTPLNKRNLAVDAFALAPGEYRFRLNATDLTYGAFSVGETHVIVVDSPVITRLVANHSVGSDTIDLSVAATLASADVAPLQVRWFAKLSDELVSLTDWSTENTSSVSLPTGNHTVQVKVRDSVGGVAISSTTLTVVSLSDQCELSLQRLRETRASHRLSDALLAVSQVASSHLNSGGIESCPELSAELLQSLHLFRQVRPHNTTQCAHPEIHLLVEALRQGTQLMLQAEAVLNTSDFAFLVGQEGASHDLLCAVGADSVHESVSILAQTGAVLSNTLALAALSLNGTSLCLVTHHITDLTTRLLIAKLEPALAGEHPEYAEYGNVFGAGAKFDAGTRVTLSGSVQVEVPESAFENAGEVSVTVSALDPSLSSCFVAENSASPDDTCSVTDINAQNGELREITFALRCSDQHQYRVQECAQPRATCRWFDAETHTWSQDGCVTLSATPASDGVHTVYQCRCTHLTTFAMVKELAKHDACATAESTINVYAPFAGAFGLVAVAALIQTVRYMAATQSHKRSAGLLLQHLVVLAVAGARVAACASDEEPSTTVTIVLLSVPMCLIYWAFTYVIIQWAGIIHFAMSNPGDPSAKLRRVFVPVNLALAVVLVVSMAIAGTGNDTAADIGSVIVASVSLFTALGFVIYGSLLLRQMSRSQQMSKSSAERQRTMREAARRLFAVTLLTSLAFIVQSTVVLWSVADRDAFASHSNAFQSVYWSAEAVTLLLLLFLYLSLVRRSIEEKRMRNGTSYDNSKSTDINGRTTRGVQATTRIDVTAGAPDTPRSISNSKSEAGLLAPSGCQLESDVELEMFRLQN